MFKSDLTTNFNHQDASMEILIMLVGAFLLGAILSWAIRNFFSEKKTTNPSSSIAASRNLRNKDIITDDLQNDDLTKISSIETETIKLLEKKGITTFARLKGIKHDEIESLFKTSTNSSELIKEAETWSHQADLANNGEWKKLTEYQDLVERAKIASHKADKSQTFDDLQKIEGIDSDIETILNKKNIFTFKSLRKTDEDTLKKYLLKSGKKHETHDTKSWPYQAGMAEKGQWEELSIYQEFMGDDNENIVNNKTDNKISETQIVDKKEFKLNSNDVKVINELETDEEFRKDDLRKIDGIGPKIQELLNNNGIYTFKDLHYVKSEELKEILDHEGAAFQVHDPVTWPHQAGLASNEKWEELSSYQEFMTGGKTVKKVSGESHVTVDKKITTKKIVKQSDDLKKIEGVGPKIESLLHDAGITTFEYLKNSDHKTLKALLEAAGPQYRMHNPETWPQQAKMAYKKEWKKLAEYQDQLLIKRDKSK